MKSVELANLRYGNFQVLSTLRVYQQKISAAVVHTQLVNKQPVIV